MFFAALRRLLGLPLTAEGRSSPVRLRPLKAFCRFLRGHRPSSTGQKNNKQHNADHVVKFINEGGSITENHGVIGVFVEEDGKKTRCSIAVRAEQSRKELEEQIRREHPVGISLRRMYAFSCKGRVADVETGLRKILRQNFGLYTPPYLGWESYTVCSADQFMEYIKTIVRLTNDITVAQEMQ